MTADITTRVADQIWNLWRSGGAIPGLVAEERPADRAEGYLIQKSLARHSRSRPLGWKIAATSVAGQRHIGVTGPMLGRIFGESVHPAGATLPFGANRMRVAEAEFAFRFGSALPPRARPYARGEMLAAVRTVHPALEIPDSRLIDFARSGEASLIADNACAHQFVLGPAAAAGWRDLDLAAHRVVAHVSGVQHDGVGSNVLGDPLVALEWAVGELVRLEIGVALGDVISTGTCVVPMRIAAGDTVAADFGSIGGVSCRFAD